MASSRDLQPLQRNLAHRTGDSDWFTGSQLSWAYRNVPQATNREKLQEFGRWISGELRLRKSAARDPIEPLILNQ